MPIHQPRLHLLSYDIANPERLRQVHRRVRASGLPLQYSVFLVPASSVEIDALLTDLDDIIDSAEDDIRVYPLPSRIEAYRYGRQQLPEGVALIQGDAIGDAMVALVGSEESD